LKSILLQSLTYAMITKIKRSNEDSKGPYYTPF
jgi:hypothetical protein